MTLKMTNPPRHEVSCDSPGCREFVVGEWSYDTRERARRAGWQLRPNRGKGARTAPDFCANHAEHPGDGGS